MRDYFKDNLKLADKVVGSYDDSSDQYSVSLQGDNMSDGYDTLTFDETSKGWPSFYSYKPDFGFSMNKEYYTLNNNDVWKHYSNTSYNNFYGVPYSSTIKFLANDNPSLVKNFLAINYEGDANWKMKSATTDLNMEAFRVYGNNDTSDVAGNTLTGDILPKFIKKENKYYAQLVNKNPGTGEGQVIGVEIAGITGFFNTVEMTNGSDLEIELFNVSHTIVKSS